MSDKIWPTVETGSIDNETRSDAEQQDVVSHQAELNEQGRIGNAQHNPFDHNRVPVERKPG